jgi:hypothetical protein
MASVILTGSPVGLDVPGTIAVSSITPQNAALTISTIGEKLTSSAYAGDSLSFTLESTTAAVPNPGPYQTTFYQSSDDGGGLNPGTLQIYQYYNGGTPTEILQSGKVGTPNAGCVFVNRGTLDTGRMGQLAPVAGAGVISINVPSAVDVNSILFLNIAGGLPAVMPAGGIPVPAYVYRAFNPVGPVPAGFDITFLAEHTGVVYNYEVVNVL